MRNLFSLRSFIPSTAPPAQNKDSKNPAYSNVRASQSPMEILKPSNQCLDNEGSSTPHLQRSLSFSSAMTRRGKDGNLRFLSDTFDSPTDSADTANHICKCPNHCQLSRENRGSLASIHDIGFDSSGSREEFIAGDSLCSSPIPSRRRADHSRTRSKTEFDGFADGEYQLGKSSHSYTSYSSGTEFDDCLVDKKMLPSLGKPSRFRHLRSSLLSCDKENTRNHSFRETSPIPHHHSTRDWTNDDFKLASPSRQTRNAEKLCHAFSAKVNKTQDYDSRTITSIEELHDGMSQPSLSSNCFSELHVPETTSYEDVEDYCADELLNVQGQKGLLEDAITDARFIDMISNKTKEDIADEELQRKVKELEEKFMLLSDETPETLICRAKNSNLTAVLQIIHNINEDRKCLTLELSSQIKSRLSERYSTEERFRQWKTELGTRTRRLEKEKTDIQSSLEIELDQRENDWLLKFENFEAEEQRLRDRVRELAEQNVSLQREISLLKTSEVDAQSRIMNSEKQINEMTASLEDMRIGNADLLQSVSELQGKHRGAEEDLDHLRGCYKEKQEENKELHKAVVKLQRICSEQERTMSGLRQGLNEELCKKAIENGDEIDRLKMEQLRLTGIEQMLRKEIESCRLEMESIGHENISLLERLQITNNCYGYSFFKLDQELRSRVESLQMHGLSLLDNSSCFLGELLEFIKCKRYDQVASMNFERIPVDDFILKYHTLKRGIENLRRNLQATMVALDDKSNLEELQRQTKEQSKMKRLKSHVTEDEMLLNIRAEAILSRLLKENLFSRELEYEQLQADFARSIRARDVLQNANQRLQDEVSCLSHKMKDLELQILKKDETIAQLHQEIQTSMTDLNAVQSMLQTVSTENNELWEEVKRLRKTNMVLENEIVSLRKKIESLEEDILLKEGQICILKDSLEKPFDTLYTTKGMKEFILE
ncbi:myosin-11-like isoform X2 [Zingiber officinale]|uniref:myosin-11-like isoform X2 n=1 Tax=Zingiber officinale TaxID=94328 RepID=UPI001C4C1320|nr:myosin-11-like isoform X2 [Zingiber officinale]